MMFRYNKKQKCMVEKGWSFFGALGFLFLVGLLSVGGRYAFYYVRNAERADALYDHLRNSFTVLSSVIQKQSNLAVVTMGEAIANNVFPEDLLSEDRRTVADYWGNRINLRYVYVSEPSPQEFISVTTLIASSNRQQVCETYLRLVENKRLKNYLRLVDTVNIVDRGNPDSEINVCDEKSTAFCRQKSWATVEDLHLENRKNICEFYCKVSPCEISFFLTQN